MYFAGIVTKNGQCGLHYKHFCIMFRINLVTSSCCNLTVIALSCYCITAFVQQYISTTIARNIIPIAVQIENSTYYSNTNILFICILIIVDLS